MIIDGTNSISNHERYHKQDIAKTIRSLSDGQKQSLLDEIQLRKATHNFVGQEYNQKACNRIESLLSGKRPK